ncbi:hypothetical protein PAAG_06893 [Paracoccidioides lutzii Pb01]|uniref:Uncharacterized protein n=1 Tax=Paracoccidioides lutzii (strain ATCC MYA-826 / Pb01) TaxID=502779 RepID=C1H802_PARBA|nr:hypothetical protein PAAG_06893 [Paracoccidioides lutzii Pb01]EEH36475.2 hypothetical protein PAAG_06893 [Paracoccidioides lutzii Pb01]
MRFENWDVLLFPEGSKVPIQEFKTQCFVTRDTESPYMHIEPLIHPQAHYAQGAVGYTPILTTFIPSMPRNSPFRVSVHSWQKPIPTRMMEGLMHPEDSVVFEIRAFIDGDFVAGSLAHQRTSWPLVIEPTNNLIIRVQDFDKNGDPDTLRFPAFHEEMLQQSHWEAGEEFGRIKIVIAEGYSRPNRNPPFERVRDLIFLSFQHAPLNILEYSNLAWPNPGMWEPASRPSLRYNLGVDYGNSREDDDAHSHSPTRPEPRGIGIPDTSHSLQHSVWHQRLYPTSQMQWPRSTFPERESRWPLQPVIHDPFVDPFRDPGFSRRARSSLDDVPMPDYVGSSTNSSRAISGMTGISFGQQNKQPAAAASINDEQYNKLIEALSPSKLTSGTNAPTNTPASVPPVASKHSVAPETRAVSHSRHPSRPGALKELPQPGVRAVSGSSARSDSDEDFGSENAPLPISLLSPSPRMKGQKEGTGSDADSPLHSSGKKNANSAKAFRRSKNSLTASTESKRKRSATSDHLEIPEDNDHRSPSPVKKTSRRGTEETIPKGSSEEMVEAKTKLITPGKEVGGTA